MGDLPPIKIAIDVWGVVADHCRTTGITSQGLYGVGGDEGSAKGKFLPQTYQGHRGHTVGGQPPPPTVPTL